MFLFFSLIKTFMLFLLFPLIQVYLSLHPSTLRVHPDNTEAQGHLIDLNMPPQFAFFALLPFVCVPEFIIISCLDIYFCIHNLTTVVVAV